MEDTTLPEQNPTAKMKSSKAPQKVEVVVANPSGNAEVNILGELSIFILRIGFSLLMIHHGLEKLQDPQGFAEFVVGKYFPFLPGGSSFLDIWGRNYTTCLPTRFGIRSFCTSISFRSIFYNGFCSVFSHVGYRIRGIPSGCC